MCLGQDNSFIVNTLSTAAASTMSVTIDGPSKAKISAMEVSCSLAVHVLLL